MDGYEFACCPLHLLLRLVVSYSSAPCIHQKFSGNELGALIAESMFKLRPSTKQDLPRILDIWRSAVDATHDFLKPQDRRAIEADVLAFFPQVNFILAVDVDDRPQGFMFVHEGHLEALFVAAEKHGLGIGKLLIAAALSENSELSTDVNEQNPLALGFYEHLGFERAGRSDVDGQGRPYPLIHLRHRPAG